MNQSIRKILIANRGEIAVRIIRTCRELGIVAAAVYSDPDRGALHVRLADEAYPLKGSKSSETYLDQEAIIRAALRSGCDAIHPGYGFLSENPLFAEAVTKAGLRFIGPSAQAIRLLGDKTSARGLAKSLGIPIVDGSAGPLTGEEDAAEAAARIGFPVLLKASAGGGGKGMRLVESANEFLHSLASARSEAKSAFGDDRIYIEKYIQAPHHVEIQIVADFEGSVIYLGERDCSIQRRHQKVIEESPSPVLDPMSRKRMGEAAVLLARKANYTNAGTVEFLVNSKGQFFFLEVNTRLQVEHPVTEVITGIDLVRKQIEIADGQQLGLKQEDIRLSGHAIECRICAEDPANEFFPSTGKLERYSVPTGPRIRVDNGAQEGDTVQIYYDPLLAKLIAWGATRGEAVEAMKRALTEYEVAGIQTTIPFCQYVLRHDIFIQGKHTTSFVSQYFNQESLTSSIGKDDEMIVALAASLVASTPADGQQSTGYEAGDSSRWRRRRAEALR